MLIEIKKSHSCVLIGSSGAVCSKSVGQEINFFLNNGKRGALITIDIAASVNSTSNLFEQINGLAIIPESELDFASANPSQNVLDRIEQALKFNKKSVRLRRLSTFIGLGTLLLILFSSYQIYNISQKDNDIISKQRIITVSEKTISTLDQEKKKLNQGLKSTTESIHKNLIKIKTIEKEKAGVEAN